ncbi:hypothetical protein LXL04_003440 [Taraxacum kok-saghyz]
MNNLPFAFLLIVGLFFISSTVAVESITSAASPAPSPTISLLGCDGKCGIRCSKAGYQERYLKYCGIYCEKCKGCVPSSPNADKSECPCYRYMKNSKGKSKCP